MKTQISRWSDEPHKRRSGLYQQQGRMILDADWNEFTELTKRRIDEALSEVVGSGVPRLATAGCLESGPAGATPLVKRAVLYVDGVRASLESSVAGTAAFALTQQADFPSPPAWPASAAQVLYADVWERSTTALEDRALLDPGLHGADTATRTQTVAQVKWCPSTINPLTDTVRNPPKGDAICKLQLRAGLALANPCDPLATEVALDAPGNYSFRLEVHDVQGSAGAPTEVTLKWSAENAAEQHAQVEVPADFKRSDYLYEFYNNTTEHHLGVHLANNFVPARAVLKDGWPLSDLPDANVFPYVRRWDGYAVLVRSGTTWSVKVLAGVVQGKDRGRLLAALPAGGTPTTGNFIYTAPDLIVYLRSLELTLTLDTRKFVAGDYWLNTVREDVTGSARVQTTSLLPIGVTHRYVLLGTAIGATVQTLTDADIRRLGFPKLADLSADRIGYSPTAQTARWSDVIDDAAVAAPLNVQRAIDLLVERLDSSDMSCLVANCGTAASASVRSLLNLAAGTQKVDAVVSRLLCDLNAGHLPIDKTDAGLPALLNVPEVSSVQQALSRLAGAATQARSAASVGTGGQFATLADAFAALASATDISLSLLPGVQTLAANTSIANKRTIRISGVGAYASRINLGALLQLSAQEIILSDVAVIGQGGGSLVLQADRVVARNNGLARATTWSPHVWSKRFGAAGADQGNSIAVDASGNVIVTGLFAGTVNFGGGDLVAVGTADVFVVKLDAAGNHLWSRRFGAAGDDRGTSVAVDGSGNVLASGHFSGTVNFGGADLTSVGGINVFVVKLDALGNHVWSQRFGSGPGASIASIVTDATGNVVFTGTFAGSINFGGTPFTSTVSGTGNLSNDLFIAKLAPAGSHLWSKAFGAASGDAGAGLAVDAGGNLLLTGSFGGTVNFGGGPLVGLGTGSNIFVVKLDPAGAHVWSKHFGDPASVEGGTNPGAAGTGMAVDASGNVVITGAFTGRVNFGGSDLVSRNFADTCVAKLSPAGNHVWSKRLVSGGLGRVASVVVDASGHVVVAGAFGQTENLGGADLVSAGGNDIYVLRLDPFGNHQWSKRFGGAGSEQPLSVVMDPSGNVLLTGLFNGTVNFGGTDLVSASASTADIFIAKLTPEPALSPLVTIRPRDATRGTDLAWSQNDMLVTVAETGAVPQARTALALATHTIGGSIAGNTINGRLLLSSELPFDMVEPLTMGVGTTSIGGGAYLSIRDNDIARLASRYETTAPNLDAHRSLVITGNTVAETNNGVIAEGITLGGNQFLTRAATDTIGFAAARQLSAVGNQATHATAALRVSLSSFQDVANALTVTRVGSPVFQPNPTLPWAFGGVGADL